MCKDEKTGTAADGYDALSDPLNAKLAAAHPELALPPDSDLAAGDDMAEHLTDADRTALAALGTAEQLARRVIAEVAAQSEPQEELPTQLAKLDSTVPRPCRPNLHEVARDDQLMENLETFDRQQLLSWGSNYRKEKEIGRGGQGVVYLVECLEEFRVLSALKVFSPEPYDTAQEYYEDMSRIAHIATLVHQIHPDNLLNVERFLKHTGIHAMVTQWIDGYDLGQLLRSTHLDKLRDGLETRRWADLNRVVFTKIGARKLRLQPGLAVYIIEKCLQGLDALHGSGIVHGDIKPSNIMLDCYGSVKLIDIGSAFEMVAPPKRHTLTPPYAAPEFSAYGELTTQSDLASLGYVLIELLSGRPAIPYSGTNLASIMSSEIGSQQDDASMLEAKATLPFRLPDLLPAHVQESAHLMSLCRRLIDPDPQKRFASAAEAIVSEGGTFGFNKQLAAGDLTVHFNRVIKGWLEDLKEITH